MPTKRELAELAARVRAVTLMPGISAAEARLRTVAILESGAYLPEAGSGLLAQLCRLAGISADEGREIRERIGPDPDAEDWPDLVDTGGRGDIAATYGFEFGSDGTIWVEGSVPLDAERGQFMVSIIGDRVPGIRYPPSPDPADGKPKLRVVSSLPEDGKRRPPPSPGAA